MSYAGHVLDAINRMKQNKALLENKRKRLARIRQMYIDAVYTDTSPPYHKPVSSEVLAQVKATIREKAHRQRKRAKRAIILILFILIIMLGLLFRLLLSPL